MFTFSIRNSKTDSWVFMLVAHGNAPFVLNGNRVMILNHSESERALRNFTVSRKNFMTINTIRGAQASAVIYSITETARANRLNVYYYIKHLLTQLPPTDGQKRNLGGA